MGTLDVPKVIQAAAGSSLGVLSLIVLVLAFLAWRFFQSSNDRVKLIAFGMMFVGAMGFAGSVLLAGNSVGDGSPQPSPAPAKTALPAATPSQSGSGSPQEVTRGVPDIAGAWRDPDGYRFVVEQDGDVFTYKVFLNGAQTGWGAGTLAGRKMTYQFTDNSHGDHGDCHAEVAADAQSINGKCDDGSAAWNFTAQREAS